MKPSKTSVILISVTFLTVLNACDPVVDYEKAIVNASSSELLLVRNNPIAFDDQDVSYSQSILLDSAVLASNARQLLTEGFDIGGSVESYVDCPGLEEEDSIFVWTETGSSHHLALTITQNDFADKHRKLSKNSCECLFEITDEMLD